MNEVLDSIKFLTENPKHVKVNQEALANLIESFRGEFFFLLPWDFPEYIGDAPTDDVIDYFMIGNSINFAFQDFQGRGRFITADKNNGKAFVGSGGMWFALKRAYEEGVPILDGLYLANVDKEELQEIFQGNFEIPMIDERLKIFKEIGSVLNQKYKGYFHNLVKQSDLLFDNGNGLVERLVRDFPSFDDSWKWKKQKAVFNKRAQLAFAMLYGRFQKTDVCRFKDIDKLTVFADYVVPTGYRNLKVFEYSDFLAKKIDERRVIGAGTLAELEMRAQTISVSNQISEAIEIPNYIFDTKMWGETRKVEGLKYPLVETIAY